MNQKIREICGNSDLEFDPEAIANNPNFVFSNDPNYQTIVLFDTEGNIINVNSWIECANYVNGGWSTSVGDLVNGEQILFLSVLFLFSGYIMLKRFLERRNKLN